MASSIRSSDGLSHFRSVLTATLSDCSERTAFTDGLVDGGAGATSQPAQNVALRTIGIVHRAAAGTAGSVGCPWLVSEFSVMPQANTIEPCLIEELAGLHMQADCDEAVLTQRLG